MSYKSNIIASFFLFISFYATTAALAEPLIVLEFSNQSEFSEGDGKNLFSINPDHSESYIVQPGDSLNSILQQFYKGSGLDWRFVQLAIVIANSKAFANNNPNFLFSDKKLFLPGKSDISKLLVGKKINNQNHDNKDSSSAQNIYFFGG